MAALASLVPDRPAPAPARPWVFPAPRELRLGNALRVRHIARPGHRLAAVGLFLDVPLDAEPDGLDGICELASRALQEGSTALHGPRFAAEIERCGATFDSIAGPHGIAIALQAPRSRLERVLDLLADTLHAPAFPPHEVSRLRAQRLDEIGHEHSTPHLRAFLALQSALYDPAQRISRPAAGTRATVARIDHTAVRTFYDAHARPATATAVVAADLPAEELTGLLERTLGRWAAPAGPPTPVHAPHTADDRTRLVVVDRPGAVQSTLMVGRHGLDRHAPTWPAQSIGIHCLGGGLTSRLDQVLRERRGYTYGITACAQPLRSGAVVSIGGAVHTAATAPAVSEIFEVLHSLPAGLSHGERTSAVNNLVQVAPLQYQTAVSTVKAVVRATAERLPADYLSTIHARLAAVTAPEATRAVVSAFPPDRLVVVAVGDAASITAPLEALGLGPLTVLGP
ncbi:M16 family metallopeptidase [Streptomyces bambusae]|uniref:M16 family metallopeptidase n=1 Tax=Streptomyces bambusae TaxID=1550616 RepID=UPI0027E1A557|nr:pitrilysin family protein [Streptomyces bambusae]